MDWEPYDRHWIRLRGPWQVAWLDDATPPALERVKLPATWSNLFGQRAGTARFIRRFQAPSRLDPDERVCVTLLDVGGQVRCQLNDMPAEPLGTALGDPACWPHERCLSFDVTDLLRASNELTLEISVRNPNAANAGLHQPVLLEIITLDFETAAG